MESPNSAAGVPDALWHGDVLAQVAINVGDQGEVRLKTLHREETVHKGVEQPLVKVVVNAATINALGEKCPHGTPRHLVRRQVGTPLKIATSIFEGSFCVNIG